MPAAAHAPLDAEEPRTRRIVDAALRLAEDGGFAAVRLRDVAEQAGVALRTLYKRFAGKDELLFAVLVRELTRLEARLEERPITGASPIARLRRLFDELTEVVCGRPKLGHAIVRALAGGSTTLPQRVSPFHERVNALIIHALRGDRDDAPPDPAAARLGAMLQNVWFATLVGWSNGLHPTEHIVASVLDAAALVLVPPPSLR